MLPPRAIYDAMVFLQWAATPPDGPQHATVTALTNGQLRLAMDQRLLDEVRGSCSGPNSKSACPTLRISVPQPSCIRSWNTPIGSRMCPAASH